MGSVGHWMGIRKLKKLSDQTGLTLHRAWVQGSVIQGVKWTVRGCVHYDIRPDGQWQIIIQPEHYPDCPVNNLSAS